LKDPLSNNVGGVKTFSSTRLHPLRFERHFALAEVCQTNLGLVSNSFRSNTQSDPTLSSIATSIMITTSNSPQKGAGCPIITAVIYCTPWGCPGSPACGQATSPHFCDRMGAERVCVRTPSFAPLGLDYFPPGSHGLRRLLYSFAASRLEVLALFHPESAKRDLTHTLESAPFQGGSPGEIYRRRQHPLRKRSRFLKW